MDSEFTALRRLSAQAGANPLLVQAAGGNTSLKDAAVMRIKASGTWLAHALERDIFVAVDLPRLRAALERGDADCETPHVFASPDNPAGLRPSIETTVHALMPQKAVVHVHCVETIAWAVLADAEALLAEPLAAFRWAFIPYARPGLPLARAIQRRLAPDTQVLVLGNHGLVVAAETVEAAEYLLERVVSALRRPVRDAVAPDRAALAAACAGSDYAPASSDETHALATDGPALAHGANAVFYPDHVVFLGVGVATGMAGGAPLVALAGKGTVIRKDAKAAVEPMGRCLADVMRRVGHSDILVGLQAEDIDRLVNWDAEKYRQGLPR